MPNFIRNKHIAEKIIFIDGISGSGKSIMGPVLSSFHNVELYRLENIFENVCRLDYFNKIDKDAAITLMRLYADLTLYKSMIAREVNLRLHDNTGLLNNPNKLRYIKRLFSKDGEQVLDRIKKGNPILQTNTHQLFSAIKLAFDSFAERLRVIEMVRHPAFMIEHHVNYVDKYCSNPREFTLWIDDNGKTVPWFADGWEEKYVSLQPIDKAIHTLSHLDHLNLNSYDSLTVRQKEQILFIPFEKFVTEPGPYIVKLESFIGTIRSRKTKSVLKRQRCPRDIYTAGRGKRSYGWKAPGLDSNNILEYERVRKLVSSQAKTESIELFEKMCSNYEKKYSIHF